MTFNRSIPSVLVVRRTRAAKLGPMTATYSGRQSCPDACPLKRSGCFADGIRTSTPWDSVTRRGKNSVRWAGFLVKVRAIKPGALWRHNIAGDLPGVNGAIDGPALRALVEANRGRRGYTYTHKPVFGPAFKANRDAIAHANANGFTINLSANNPAHADRLASLGIGPVAVVLPADTLEKHGPKLHTPAGRVIQVCPAVTGTRPNCAQCGACASAGRGAIIGFPAHGIGKGKADKVARS